MLPGRAYRTRGWLVAALAAVAVMLVLSGAARAATITVTTTTDETTSGDSSVSLREAVTSINNGSDLDADVAAHRTGLYGTNDTIVVHANGSHYAVTSGELLISKPLSLVGDGASTTTIDGGLANRILHSNAGSLSVSGLTLTRGAFNATGATPDGGGAIKADSGTLTVTNAAFTSNSATLTNALGTGGGGAIWAGGNTTINGTSFSTNSAHVTNGNANGGGAVYVKNPLSVSLTDDRFSGDSFSQTSGSANEGGGGLYVEAGPITLTRTSFSGETVTVDENGGSSGGGAIYDDGGGTTATASSLVGNTVTVTNASNVDGGGALYADGGSGDVVDIRGSTIAHNTVSLSPATVPNSGGGGIFSGGGQVTLINDTLSDNGLTITSGGQPTDGGGALFNFGPGTLTNDTVASNSTNTRGGALFQADGTETLKNTIVAGNTAASGKNCSGATIASNGNNIEDANTCGLTKPTDRRNTNPLIGPLHANGGLTLTRALLPGSPAIDHGDNAACPNADQRGVHRPQPPGGVCDIGAYERLADRSGPTISIKTPAEGAHYKQGQKVNAGYHCSDPSGVAFCQGPAANGHPIDTSTLGGQKFTVKATDKLGHKSSKTVHYTVDSTVKSPPVVTGFPPNDGCVPKGLTLKVSVHPTALKEARVFLDGARIASSTKPRFTVKIAASQLAPGRHKLKIERDYKSGTQRRSISSFAVCKGGGKSPHIRIQGTPDKGTCTAAPFRIVVTITAAVTKTISVKFDKRSPSKPNKPNFTLTIDTKKLKAGVHVLTIKAQDKFKNSSLNATKFVRCA